MFNKKVSVYVARGMTGRDKAELVAEATRDREFLERCEINVLCPVTAEGVKSEHRTLRSSKKQMDQYWFRDKAMIREANVVVDATPLLKSEGVSHEIGYGRYFLWKKVVRVFPPGQLPLKSSVAFYEDDYLTDSWTDAVMEIYRTHGTYWKRLKWRLSIINRCLLRAIGLWFLELFR